MKKLGRFYYLGGLVLLAGGCVLGRAGCLRMVEYIRLSAGNTGMTGGQFARGLVLPHIMVLFGMGGGVFGLILTVRGLMLRKRMAGRE